MCCIPCTLELSIITSLLPRGAAKYHPACSTAVKRQQLDDAFVALVRQKKGCHDGGTVCFFWGKGDTQVAFKRNTLDLHPTQDASKWQTKVLFDPLAIPEPDIIIIQVGR